MIEIEKTYLVKKIPINLSSYKSDKIQQGYISSTSPSLRIRKKGDKYELTKKIRPNINDYSTAEEINIPLTKEEFDKLWSLVEKSLEKTRYYIPLDNNLIAELDIFEGKLENLAWVEVEFTSQEQMNSFKSPDWFGQDITQEEFSANSFLAGKNYSDIKPYIAKLDLTINDRL